jgi:hypothetical protein
MLAAISCAQVLSSAATIGRQEKIIWRLGESDRPLRL